MKPTLVFTLTALLLAPLAALHAADALKKQTVADFADDRALPLVLPRVVVVEREGITGAGLVVQDGKRLLVLYPNHPDDFGGSGGCGASVSDDGGATWQAQPDDWPLGKTVDVWVDRLRNGDWIAIGLNWAPDPKKRGELTAKDVPADAYQLGISSDGGLTWRKEPMVIEHPTEFGIIARPLPHVFEDESGTLFMPAYAWGKTGNHALLLHSKDRGRRWTVLSSITSAAAMVKAGAPVTTPWLETTVSPTRNGDWLAIVRTGSSAKSSKSSRTLRSASKARSSISVASFSSVRRIFLKSALWTAKAACLHQFAARSL